MSDTADKFTDLLRRLVRVPKAEIDEQERLYQESKKDAEPAKPGQIVPTHNERGSAVEGGWQERLGGRR
jgi:hypothetical protein